MTALTDTDGYRPVDNHAWFDLAPVGTAPLVGDVVAFDDAVGMGVVEYGPGRRLDFHCTAITDGSRSIPVGSVVAFVITPGHLGRLEARSVRPLPGVMPPGATLEGTPVVRVKATGGGGHRGSGGSPSGGDPVGSGPAGPGSASPGPGEATPPSGTEVD
jgi:hypothetical protein